MYMYQNNLVATVKVGGKILRENQSTVAVPFGSEYSIYLKNLNTVRALVTITIDGKDVTAGGLVLNPKMHLDFERSLSNNNLTHGNKFKFIERTSAVEEHRGIGAEDGLIQIEYKFEVPQPSPFRSRPSFSGESLRSAKLTKSSGPSASIGTRSVDMSETSYSYEFPVDAINEAGITVNGSESKQSFIEVASFPTETAAHVIVIKLKGAVQGKKIVAPITVQHKPKCDSCGKVNKATANFCVQCGTGLQVFV
jgi:hypothetical protein